MVRGTLRIPAKCKKTWLESVCPKKLFVYQNIFVEHIFDESQNVLRLKSVISYCFNDMKSNYRKYEFLDSKDAKKNTKCQSFLYYKRNRKS